MSIILFFNIDKSEVSHEMGEENGSQWCIPLLCMLVRRVLMCLVGSPIFISFQWLHLKGLIEDPGERELVVLHSSMDVAVAANVWRLESCPTSNFVWHGFCPSNKLRCRRKSIVRTRKLILEVNKTRDELAQARSHTQRYMNNAWSEMVSSTPCFALHWYFLIWFIQTTWIIVKL
jgi:hypothetical protein